MNDKIKEDLVNVKAALKPAVVARFITRNVVRHSVSATVVTIVNSVAPDATTRKEKIELYVAVWAISGMIAERAADYTNDKFDSYHAMIKQLMPKHKDEDDSEIEVPQQEVPIPE